MTSPNGFVVTCQDPAPFRVADAFIFPDSATALCNETTFRLAN